MRCTLFLLFHEYKWSTMKFATVEMFELNHSSQKVCKIQPLQQYPLVVLFAPIPEKQINASE